jgi:hypothetical protein
VPTRGGGPHVPVWGSARVHLPRHTPRVTAQFLPTRPQAHGPRTCGPPRMRRGERRRRWAAQPGQPLPRRCAGCRLAGAHSRGGEPAPTPQVRPGSRSGRSYGAVRGAPRPESYDTSVAWQPAAPEQTLASWMPPACAPWPGNSTGGAASGCRATSADARPLRKMASRLALLAVLLASSRLAFGSFIVETALLEVLSPNTANFSMAVANFGNPLYGGTLRCVGPTLLQPWQTQPQGRQTLGASRAPEGLSFTSPPPWCHPYDTCPPTPAHARVSRFHSSPRGEVQYLRQERYACTALQARGAKFPGLSKTAGSSFCLPPSTPARPSADATGTTGTLRKQQRAGDARHRAGGPGWCVADVAVGQPHGT